MCRLVIATLLLCVLAHAQQQAGTSPNPFASAENKTIMVISPHPDDDLLGAGGALAFLAGRNNHLISIFLTSGEKGSLDPDAKPARIGAIRQKEARAAYKALGFTDPRLIWLGYPDGQLDYAPRQHIQEQLTILIRRFRPDIVFALDPGGKFVRYHYRDHRTAALVAADAIGSAMWPLEFPRPGLKAFRVPDVYYFYTAEPTVHLDITSVYERKLQALSKYRSQF